MRLHVYTIWIWCGFVLLAAASEIPVAASATEASATVSDSLGGASGSPSTPTFAVSFGGPSQDRGIAVEATADGGFAAIGTTRSFGAGEEDVYLVRTDADGVLSFSKSIGGARQDCGWSIHELDSGFVIAGFTESFGAGGSDAYLIRTDARGDTLWTRTYGGPEDELVWSVLPVEDGFVLAGQTASSGAGDFDFYLLRTDLSGELLWERTYGGAGVDRAFSVQQMADGGFVLAGITYSFGAGGRDGWVVATDAAGNERWNRALGSAGYDVIHAVCATREPGCLAVGYSSGLGLHGGQDGWIVKLDPEGKTEWSSVFGGSRDERILNGEQTSDGGFALTGFTLSTESGWPDAYLVKVDGTGSVEWTRNIGGRGEDSGYGITTLGDGGLVVVGLTKSVGAGAADLLLIRTDALGRR